jgi:hypothetical protein
MISNIKHILDTLSERPWSADFEKNVTMSNWSDRFVKKILYREICSYFTKCEKAVSIL